MSGRLAGATKEEVDSFKGEEPHKAVPNVTVGLSNEEEIIENSEPKRQREMEDESSSEEEIFEDSKLACQIVGWRWVPDVI
ncbi:hypothetical protein FRC07_001574 [Ceratobasidium sp. 392]|nr:hypothetical protein FRC07_001574 [Ceratobasidium sp. 392]